MLLIELLNKTIPSIHQSHVNRDASDVEWLEDGGYKKPNKWEELGHGAQASAFFHPKTNTVIKILYANGPQDPAYQFLRLCLKHQSNPYLPKIYAVKQYPTKDPSLVKIMIQMEKLERVDSSNVRLVSKVLKTPIRTPMTLKNDMQSDQFRQQLIQKAEDPQLKQALRLIEPLFRHYDVDLHMDNIMLRTTGSTPQVVFTDPVTKDEE
jgi:hypothetical protein